MLVDEYEQYPNEKTDVVVVSRSGSDEPDSRPSATDRTFCFLFSPRFRQCAEIVVGLIIRLDDCVGE